MGSSAGRAVDRHAVAVAVAHDRQGKRSATGRGADARLAGIPEEIGMLSRRVFMKNGGLALLSLGFAPAFVARTAEAAGGGGRHGVITALSARRGGGRPQG